MTCAERTLTEEVPGSSDEVRAFYTDLTNLKLVHPLVVSVRTIERRESANGHMQTYRVRDRIPLGLFTVKTNYVARLHVPVTSDVVAEAVRFRACVYAVW